MFLSAKACAAAFALLWGGCLLFVAVLNWVAPPYGGDFLRIAASVYPGYRGASTIADIGVGTLWGIADGAIAGFLFGWLYNRCLTWISNIDSVNRPMGKG